MGERIEFASRNQQSQLHGVVESSVLLFFKGDLLLDSSVLMYVREPYRSTSDLVEVFWQVL